MRLGFIFIQDAADQRTWSGIPFQILKHLRAQGVDVHVLSPLDTKARYVFAPAKLMARAKGKNLTLDHYPLVLHSYARQIDSFVKSKGIDVVFSASTIPVTSVKTDRPVITWTDAVFHAMHGYYDKAFSTLTAGAIRRGQEQEEKSLRRCSIAAYASTWARNSAAEIVDASKLRVLLFGSSLPVDHTAKDVAQAAREKRASRKNRCELLFVGVDWERKGGDVAVEVTRLLNESGIEARLTAVGGRPERVLPEFVDHLGFVDKNSEQGIQRLTALYRRADFFLLPTRAEAAGIVFSEASSFGLPVFTFATGGVPDYVRDGVNGRCLPLDTSPAEMANQISSLLSNADEYEGFSRRAFAEYSERLNWSSSVRQLVELCRNSLVV